MIPKGTTYRCKKETGAAQAMYVAEIQVHFSKLGRGEAGSSLLCTGMAGVKVKFLENLLSKVRGKRISWSEGHSAKSD